MMFFALSLLIFIDAMTIGIVLPVFAPLFTQDPGHLFAAGASLSARQFAYTMIISLPMLFLVFGPPLLGQLSDKYGRRLILLAGLIGIAFSSLLSVASLYIGSLLLLFISRILIGVLDGTEAIAQAAIADLSTPKNKAKNMSLITFAASVGFTFGPVMGGFLSDPHLVSWFNYHTPFYAALILALLNAFILRLTFRETYKPPAEMALSYRSLLKNTVLTCFDKRIAKIALVFLAIEFCWAGYFQTTTLDLARKLHYSSSQIGIFMAYLSIVFTLGLILLRKILLRYFHEKTIIICGGLLTGYATLLLALIPNNPVLIWIAVIPVTVGVAVSYNVMLATMSNAVSETEQGKVMGASTALTALAWISAGVLIGLMTHTEHGLYAIFGASVIAAMFYWWKV